MDVSNEATSMGLRQPVGFELPPFSMQQPLAFGDCGFTQPAYYNSSCWPIQQTPEWPVYGQQQQRTSLWFQPQHQQDLFYSEPQQHSLLHVPEDEDRPVLRRRHSSGRIIPIGLHDDSQHTSSERLLHDKSSLSGSDYFQVAYVKDVLEGDDRGAEHYYKKALKEGKPEATVNMAFCYLDQGKFDKACKQFEKAWKECNCDYSQLMYLFCKLRECHEHKRHKHLALYLQQLRELTERVDDELLRTQAEIICYHWHTVFEDSMKADDPGSIWRDEMKRKITVDGSTSLGFENALQRSLDEVLGSEDYKNRLSQTELDLTHYVRISAEKLSTKARKAEQKKIKRAQKKKRLRKRMKKAAVLTGQGLLVAGQVALVVLEAMGEMED